MANETHYVTHSAGAFLPDTIHTNFVDPIEPITLQLKIDGEDLLENPVRVADANRFDRADFTNNWRHQIVI